MLTTYTTATVIIHCAKHYNTERGFFSQLQLFCLLAFTYNVILLRKNSQRAEICNTRAIDINVRILPKIRAGLPIIYHHKGLQIHLPEFLPKC